MESLLGTLLPLIVQYGPSLVKDTVDLIHGNPQQQNETDEAYIVRLNNLTESTLQKVLDQDKTVEQA
jgi:hypothetical protein